MSASVLPRGQTFRKSERLSSRKIIEVLAKTGKKIHVSPLRLVWMNSGLKGNVPVQATFAVSKKNFRKAVDRNKIKRRMREAYRKNKSTLYSLISDGNNQYAFLFVFTGNEIISFE